MAAAAIKIKMKIQLILHIKHQSKLANASDRYAECPCCNGKLSVSFTNNPESNYTKPIQLIFHRNKTVHLSGFLTKLKSIFQIPHNCAIFS